MDALARQRMFTRPSSLLTDTASSPHMPPHSWVLAYFAEPPDAGTQKGKVKGYCKKCLRQDLAMLRAREEEEVSNNFRNAYSSVEELTLQREYRDSLIELILTFVNSVFNR